VKSRKVPARTPGVVKVRKKSGKWYGRVPGSPKAVPLGGAGSGSHDHWWRPAKKTAVEHYRHLDANRWTREGILRAGVRHAGAWRWTDATTGEERASIGYEVDTKTLAHPRLWLAYACQCPASPQAIYDIAVACG
jgi:hypothetical protein